MEKSLLARRYVKALGQTAVKMNKLDEVSRGVLFFAENILTDQKVMDFLSSTSVSHSSKKDFIDGNKDNLSGLLCNCLNVLIDNRRFFLLSILCDEWKLYEKKQRKIIPVVIITSLDISEKINGQIMSFIRKLYPDCEHEVLNQTDPSIMGGFILIIENVIYDYSVSGSFDRMKNHIMNSSI
jgi:F-type H+-transporting ATPase subunit delta